MRVPNQKIPFNYLGAKYSVLPWLLPLLPDTKSFVDLFGGSAAVILNKKPSQINTYNDINGDVVNFFRVLRDHPDQLITLLELTPHSIAEYKMCQEYSDDPIENARSFFVRTTQSFMSVGAHKKNKGWLAATKVSRVSISEATSKILSKVSGLHEIVSMLRMIQIENRSYQHVFKAYDFKESLIYCDPPYDNEFRSEKKNYHHDFTEEDHISLSELCRSAKGKVAVSGYDSSLMRDLYSGFHCTVGPKRKNTRATVNTDVRECLWTNYDPKAIHSNTLFQ